MSTYDFDRATEVLYGSVPVKAVKLGTTHVWSPDVTKGPGWSIIGEEIRPGVITLHVSGTGWPRQYKQGSVASGFLSDGLQLTAPPGDRSISVVFGPGDGSWPIGPVVYAVKPAVEINIPIEAALDYSVDQWEGSGMLPMPRYTCPAGGRINFLAPPDPDVGFMYGEAYVSSGSGMYGTILDDGALTGDGKMQTRYGGKWSPPLSQQPGATAWLMIHNDRSAQIDFT